MWCSWLWCNVYFHFIVVIYHVISIMALFMTLCTPQMQWYRGSSFKLVQMAFEAIFEFILINAQIEGELNYIIGFKWFFEYFVSLNCVVINHQKGGDWKCIWPPKWVLVLMTLTIKELMRLLRNVQVQKSLKWKRAINDAIFA